MTDNFFHLGENFGAPKPLDLSQFGGDTPEAFDPLPALAAEGVPLPIPVEVGERPDNSDPGVAVSSGNPKDLIGATKPDVSLVPPAALLHTATAMMDGANKYGPYNWRENPVKARVYVAAAMRHLQQFLDGENVDPISGVHHIGHASACCAIILDAAETGNLLDDRPLPGSAGQFIRNFKA